MAIIDSLPPTQLAPAIVSLLPGSVISEACIYAALSLLWSCIVEFYNSFEVCISIMYDIVIAVVVGNIMGHQEKPSLCPVMHAAIATAA